MMNDSLSAILASVLSTNLIKFSETGGKSSLCNVTVGKEYKVLRFLTPGDRTINSAPVDSYGVEFYNDVDKVVCVDLLDGKAKWVIHNVESGDTITSEDGEKQVASEDAVSAMLDIVGEIVRASGDVEIQQMHDETVLAVKGMNMEEAQAYFMGKLAEILSEQEASISPGDKVRVTRSDGLGYMFYNVGEVYTVARVDAEGNFTLKDTMTDLYDQPIPMEGLLWSFEKV